MEKNKQFITNQIWNLKKCMSKGIKKNDLGIQFKKIWFKTTFVLNKKIFLKN